MRVRKAPRSKYGSVMLKDARYEAIINYLKDKAVEQYNNGEHSEPGFVYATYSEISKAIGYAGCGGCWNTIEDMNRMGMLRISKGVGKNRKSLFDMRPYLNPVKEEVPMQQESEQAQASETVQVEDKNKTIIVELRNSLDSMVEYCKSLSNDLDLLSKDTVSEKDKQIAMLTKQLDEANQKIAELQKSVEDAKDSVKVNAYRFTSLFRDIKDDIISYKSKPNWQKNQDREFYDRIIDKMYDMVSTMSPNVLPENLRRTERREE